MKRSVGFVAVVTAVLTLLSGCSTPAPLSITSLTSTSIAGGATYRWNITYAAGVTLTCTLDANGNGTADATLPNCESITSYDHMFTAPGRYSSKLTVTDSKGRSTSATVTTIAAGTSATPYTWASQFGSSNYDSGYGVTSDTNGNIILVGEADGALPGQTSAGPADIALAQYDANGNQIWTTQFGSSSYDSANGVTSDASRNITLVGSTSGALPGHTSLGGSDIVLAKYDTHGNQLWTRQLGTSALDYGNAVTTDASGNTTLVGDSYGAVAGHTSAGGADIVLAKYDPTGNQLWITQFGGSANDFGFGITSDASGNTTLVGTTYGALPGHTNAGGTDIVLAKYDPNGNQLWTTQFGTSADDEAWGIASDSNGNTIIVGDTYGALPAHASAGGSDIVLAKYDSRGNQLWATQFGTSGDDVGSGVTSDAAGNATLSGYVTGALPGHTSAGGTDLVLAEYDPIGDQVWTRQSSITGNDEGNGITSDGNGNTIFVGDTDGALPGSVNAGGYDIVIGKYLP